MAGHGGGGGGHGGGSRGLSLPKNGCLRYLVLWVIALLVILGGLFAGALRFVPGLSSLSTAAGTTSIQSRPVQAAPTAAPPVASTGNSGTTAQGGGAPATAPQAVINAAPLQGAQGALITPYTAPAFYIVRARDTLEGVAAMFGTTADALRSYNYLTSDQLLIDQVLYLPPVAYNPVPPTGRNAGHDTQAPAGDGNGGQ